MGSTPRGELDARRLPTEVSRRVLVVDDHVDTREIYAVLLRGSGYTAYQAGDGPGALAVLRNTDIDVAVIDIGLPGMDGYELARQIRADAAFSHVMLIALTGHGLPEDRARSRAVGFDRHLVKPVTPSQFIGALDDSTPHARGG